MARGVLLVTLLTTVLAPGSPFAAAQEPTAADANRFEGIGNQLEAAQRFPEAIRAWLRVVQIRRETSGENSAPFADALAHLAMLHLHESQDDLAEPLFYRVVEIQKQLHGPNSPEYAIALNDLGIVYQRLRSYDLAERRFSEALELRKRNLDHNDPDYSLSLYNLAWTYGALGQHGRAEPLLKEVLNIDRSAKRTAEAVYGTHLRSLAWLYYAENQYDTALPMLIEVVEIDTRFAGKFIPGWVANQDIQDMNTLGLTYLFLHRYREAETTLLRAKEKCETARSSNRLLHASVMTHLGLLYQSTGRTGEALRALDTAMEKEQADLDRGIYGIRDYIDAIRFSLVGLVSVAAMSHDDAAAKLAFDWTIQRKAFGLDVRMTIAQIKVKGWYGDDPEVFRPDDRIHELKRQIHQLTFTPPAGADAANLRRALLLSQAALNRAQDDLDRQFSMALQLRDKIHIETIQQRLPPGSALIEFLSIPEYDFKATGNGKHWTEPRYVAFVLSSEAGAQTRLIDIGDAEKINRQIAQVRAKIAGFRGLSDEKEAEAEYQRASRGLYDALFRQSGLRQALGRATRVYVSPDGELSRISFEALNDQDQPNRYLAEDYSFVYLPAARYLLVGGLTRRASSLQGEPGTVVFAAPDYNLKASERKARVVNLLTNGREGPALRSVGDPGRPVAGVVWKPLKGASEEADAVKSALEGGPYGPVKVYKGPDALQEVLRLVHGPRILHVATHGYFLPNPKLDRPDAEAEVGFSGTLGRVQLSDDPLLRSGLVFAGANVVEEPDPKDTNPIDGWMTAADVALMDLSDTELVVLSACDTGLGDAKAGDGVQGLQQSFLSVGVRALVMTLYATPDQEGPRFIRNFYDLLAAGEDKASALHKAQLSVIADRRKRYSAAHPYFWGSYIFLGQSAAAQVSH